MPGRAARAESLASGERWCSPGKEGAKHGISRADRAAGLPSRSRFPALVRPARPKPDFSPLEWSVIRLARIDRLWTIREPGRLRRLSNWLLARGNPSLANQKLEALRRMAVLSWHYGFTVPGEDVAQLPLRRLLAGPI